MRKPTDPAKAMSAAVKHFRNGQFVDARRLLLEVVKSHPRDASVRRLLGVVSGELKLYGDAVRHFETVIAIEPSANDYFNLGKCLHLAGECQHALAAYEAGLALSPADQRLLQGKASALTELGRLDEAIELYRLLIAADPNFVEALANLGEALRLSRRGEEALPIIERAFALDPAHAPTLSKLVRLKLALWSWDGIEQLIEDLIAKASQSVDPLLLLTVSDDPHVHLAAARGKLGGARTGEPAHAFSKLRERSGKDRVRVAYLSADYRKHPTTFLMAGLFEAHDRDRFEIIAISTGPDDQSEIRARIAADADSFIDIAPLSEAQSAKAVADVQPHILIDLMGHTRDARQQVFKNRIAPVQACFLGYPGTTGNALIDYNVLDPFIATPEVLAAMTERAVVMPHCYQPNDRLRPRPITSATRESYGLPAQGVVFCCFNNTAKLTPDVFGAWMEILKAVESSVLWLYVTTDTARRNILEEARRRGVDPNRLVFAEQAPLEAHLARYLAADVLLDTFPYGAHTTGSDALWMGCPIVTISGRSFASRVAGSLLTTVGLSELVARDIEGYKRLAIDLASRPAKLAAMRRHLETIRPETPLFDTAKYTRHLEMAYMEMHRRWLAGQRSREIQVASLMSESV